MKKYLNAFCSITASIFIFVTMSVDWFKLISTYNNSIPSFGNYPVNAFGEISFTGWQLLKIDNVIGSTMYKISAILLVILAVILLISATLIILQNLNIIKNDFNFNKVNAGLLTIFAILSIITLSGSVSIAETIADDAVFHRVRTFILGGAYTMTASGILACIFGWIFYKKQKKQINSNQYIDSNNQ